MSTRPNTLASLFHPLDLRRGLLLVTFFGLLVVFRHLLIVLLFFVAFETLFTRTGRWISRKTPLSHGVAALLVLLVAVSAVAVGSYLGIDRLLQRFTSTEDVRERLLALRQLPVVARVGQYVNVDALLHAARANADRALGYAVTFGHVIVFAMVGLILSIVHLFEEDDVAAFRARLSPHSLVGTLVRWVGYTMEAIGVFLQFQVIVAAVNAVLTFPVLLLVGIPRPALYSLLVFVASLVPVVGNFVAGTVLTLLAYQARGLGGAAAFLVLTFLLHKVESYYLNPRLAARHVNLPGFVLIVSLLLWEQLLGFVGLFVSFPFLFLAMRINHEFRTEDAVVTPAPAGVVIAAADGPVTVVKAPPAAPEHRPPDPHV